MKSKLINYFFDEDEMDLVENYTALIKVVAVCLTIGLIVIVL